MKRARTLSTGQQWADQELNNTILLSVCCLLAVHGIKRKRVSYSTRPCWHYCRIRLSYTVVAGRRGNGLFSYIFASGRAMNKTHHPPHRICIEQGTQMNNDRFRQFAEQTGKRRGV